MNPALTLRQQGFIVAGLGAASLVVAGLIFATARGMSEPAPVTKAQFVPSDAQLRSFSVQTVTLRSFRTEIETDGYVAAGGGGGKSAGGLPILPSQANDTLQAENDLTSAQVQYRNAAAAEDRQHKLYQSEGAALKDWQQSQADLATAAAAVASAHNRLRLQGKTDSGKAGAFVLDDNSSVWLIANVREADAALVRTGDPLTALLTAFPGKTVSGEVSFVSSVIDPAMHRLAIGARVRNPDGLLKPNMLATLTIQGGEAKTAPAVPLSTLIHDGERTHVWVVGPGRKLSLRDVKAGRTSNGFVEITARLTAGERVATAGGLFIDQATNGE